MLLLLHVAACAGMRCPGWWLSYWSDNMESHSQAWFLGIYTLLTVVSLVVIVVLRVCFAKSSVRAARVVHEVGSSLQASTVLAHPPPPALCILLGLCSQSCSALLRP